MSHDTIDQLSCVGKGVATKSSVLKHAGMYAARVERRLPTFSNHSECAKAWACTATRIVYHDRVAQQFVVRPREGAACRTDLNLSQDSGIGKQLMQRYGPDGWVLHLEGRELVYRSFRHTGGCVYEANYRLEHRGRFHATVSSTHEGTGAGVDESTPHWHRTEFAPMHSAWELLETTNSPRALTPAERCSPWGRWVWPDAEGSTPWVAAGPCFGGTAFSGYDGMPWRVNLTQFVWRAYPGCEPSYLSGWRSLNSPERVEACLRSTLRPGQRTAAVFLGDSNMRGYYSALPIAGVAQGSMTSLSKTEDVSALRADRARHVCTMKEDLLMSRVRSAPNRTVDYSCSKLSQCALESSLHSFVEWGQNRIITLNGHWSKWTLPNPDAVPYGERISAPWCPAFEHGVPVLVFTLASHPASQAHWALREYEAFVTQLAEKIRRWLQRSPSSVVVWVEGHTLPARAPETGGSAGSSRKQFSDWRTIERIDSYNRIATPLMEAAGARVVPLADMSGPVAEASSDGAHARPFLARAAVQMVLAASCPQWVAQKTSLKNGR